MTLKFAERHDPGHHEDGRHEHWVVDLDSVEDGTLIEKAQRIAGLKFLDVMIEVRDGCHLQRARRVSIRPRHKGPLLAGSMTQTNFFHVMNRPIACTVYVDSALRVITKAPEEELMRRRKHGSVEDKAGIKFALFKAFGPYWPHPEPDCEIASARLDSSRELCDGFGIERAVWVNSFDDLIAHRRHVVQVHPQAGSLLVTHRPGILSTT